MAENYKLLYEQMKKMLEMYQDEIVPNLRKELDKRVNLVYCRDCAWYREYDPEYKGICSKVPSNGDRIRAMSDEELAESLEAWQDWGGGLTTESWLKWLKELAEVE